MTFNEIKDNLKKKVYNIAGKLENKAKKGEGIPGGIADIAKGIGKIVNTTVNEAKSIHEGIKKQGGYKKMAQDTLETVSEKMDEAYQSLEDTFFTNGSFDKEKAKNALNNTAEATRKYGSKAVQDLSKMIKDNIESIKKDYRSFVPTKEEREGKYRGIGSAYKGNILFRDDFESCLIFYDKARENIPETLKSKKPILKDIKASASKNVADLVEFYSPLEGDGFVRIKKEISQKYLK